MIILQSIILGAIQGLTEFLPVSSSAHLILIPLLFGFDGNIAESMFFDVTLHFGTLLAILAFFYKDWIALIKGLFTSAMKRKAGNYEEKLIWYLIFSTIPAAVAGVLFEDSIEALFHNGDYGAIFYITIPLLIVSLVMIFSEKFALRTKSLDTITLKDSLIIGFAQMLALVPGVSRSGITICAALLLGYNRSESAKFSFLLSTPIVFGAFLLKFLKCYDTLNIDETLLYIIGATTSAIIGYLSIKYMLKFLAKRTLNAFAFYRIGLATLLIILLCLNSY